MLSCAAFHAVATSLPGRETNTPSWTPKVAGKVRWLVMRHRSAGPGGARFSKFISSFKLSPTSCNRAGHIRKKIPDLDFMKSVMLEISLCVPL